MYLMWKHPKQHPQQQQQRIGFLAPEGLLAPEVHINGILGVEQILQTEERCVVKLLSIVNHYNHQIASGERVSDAR